MIRSTFISAISLLVAFSAISYSQSYAQQDPKPIQPQAQPVQPVQTSNAQQDSQNSNPSAVTSPAKLPVEPLPAVNEVEFVPAVPAQTYEATAYSLRGRTASGRYVTRGLIAADPRVLPLGTRVRLEAGPFSGEYLVADTGGAVKGRRIDIWTPSTREALQFGRRPVKLTVLSFGGKRARPGAVVQPASQSVRARRVNTLTPPTPAIPVQPEE